MERMGKRAVVASVSDPHASGLVSMLESFGYAVSGHARDASAALFLAESLLPDLILADAVLPGMDGAALAERLFSMPINRHPAILLMTLPGAPVSGLDRIMAQGVAVVPKPCMKENFAEAVENLAIEKRCLPGDKAMLLDRLMDMLGVPRHPGRDYLADAVTLVWMDSSYVHSLKGKLYPAIYRKRHAGSAPIERAIRYVIDHAWRTGELEQQHKIFGDTIDARRGKPTCGEMIARLADILRWEGNK